MEKFRFFEHTADVEFEAYGKTLEEAFENAALAMFGVITKPEKVEPKTKKELAIESEDLKSLLYDFLEKFLIFHDSENLVFSKCRVFEIKRIKQIKKEKLKEETYALKAEAEGEEFASEKHESRTAVKAVTYHSMQVGKKNGIFFVHVILDV